MNKYTILGIIIIIVAIIVLGWAPWMNNQNVHDKIMQEKGSIDGTIDKNT